MKTETRAEMKIAWCLAVMAAMAAGGCEGLQTKPAGGNGDAMTSDPSARAFSGQIISLRPTISTMIVSKEEKMGRERFPNQIIVKYDAQTKFLIDGKPATLDQIEQYMNVSIEGHMRGEQLFAETAKFSSVLPPNVKRPGEAPRGTETQPGAEKPGQP